MSNTMTITQSDREAIAAYYRDGGADRLFIGRITAGDMDSDPHVQAFATHREASEAPLKEQIAQRDALLREVLEPILHWYQSDEHPPRDLADILRDAIADLQSDRAIALKVRAAAEALRPFSKASDRAVAKALRMEEFGMGSALQNTTGTWGVQASDLHQAKEALTQIDTLLSGCA